MKKIISLFCAFALLLSLSSVAFATEIDMDTEIGELKLCSTYQDVLDMLNKEYGTNVHFPSDQECKEYGISVEKIDLSLEEFEAQMRKDIEANLQANAEAIAATTKLEKSKIVESGSGVCTESDLIVLSTYEDVVRYNQVAGATVYLTATISDSLYWHYTEIKKVQTFYTKGNNSTPAFSARTYNYELIDSRRTCALHLYGFTCSDYGVIIDNNAVRYVEFWAGNGM